MTIYLASDHRGFQLKSFIKDFLKAKSFEVFDLGNDKYDEADDYPDFAERVARKVAVEPAERRGILICGSGVGVDVVANKFKGVRSALIFNEAQARASRNDDDVNVLSLPADFLDENKAKKILEVWLETPFSGEERYKRRLQKIKQLELRN
ncbi:RpiB/LacA/LacB family sugar-phosphate isomerase [Candidatus Wolfebacteria bacterium]|nr:RpiB/LacA/LacB family sugar-phosphate isomerase [Candidatus Wolfebacteria bacterium]